VPTRTARRGLLISWGDRSAGAPILEAAALGRVEFYLVKPAWSPDEQFHRAVTESLEQWWRQQGGRFEAVAVIAKAATARAHELRDILTRISVPFGFTAVTRRRVRRRWSVWACRVRRVRWWHCTTAPYWWIPLTPRWVPRWAWTSGRPSSPMTLRSWGRAGRVGCRGIRSVGRTACRVAGTGGVRWPGRDQLVDQELLGFPRGVSGVELASRAYEQAWLFGTHFIYGNPATSRATDGGLRVVGLHDGSQLRSRAVIISTGMEYRRLGVPQLDGLLGAGVFYGAATVEAPAMVGKQALVVGGGNSAGQAALYLSKYAAAVTVLVRSGSLAASMSAYLIREIDSAPNVAVRFGVEVIGGGGDGRLQHLQLRNRHTGEMETSPPDGRDSCGLAGAPRRRETVGSC
jgi:thioredoxin reductase (NADPH)